MARALWGIRIAVVCTVLTGSGWAAGPAHAGVGDLADGALGGTDGGAVGDTVEDAVDDTLDTAAKVTGSADAAVKDTVRTVRNVTEAAPPSPQEHSDSGGRATEPIRTPVEPRPDSPVVATPQPASVTRVADTSPESPTDDRAQQRVAHADRAHGDRTRAPDTRRAHRASPPRDVPHRSRVAVRGAQELAAPLSLPAGHPCASGSLATQALRQCARADLSLPGLGGFPMLLPPIGVVLVGMGLLLVARGRRRLTAVALAT